MSLLENLFFKLLLIYFIFGFNGYSLLFFFLICSEQGLLFVLVHGVSLRGLLLWAQALGTWASVAAAHRLSSCGSWALGHEASGAVVQGLSG